MSQNTEPHSPFDPRLDLPPKPHRGGLIILLGILGFVTGGLLGILAWVWGNQDLRDMNIGLMDDSGMEKTVYGRIIGIISIIFAVLATLVKLFFSEALMLPPQ